MADYRGDQYLFQGLQGLGQGAAKNIEEHQAEKQRVLDNAKISDMVFKVNPELLQSLGMPPEDYQSLSARDRTNLAGGVLQAMGYKRGQADERRKADLAAAQIGSYRASTARSNYLTQEAQKDAAGEEAFNSGLAILSSGALGLGDVVDPTSNANIVNGLRAPPAGPTILGLNWMPRQINQNDVLNVGAATGQLGRPGVDNLISTLGRNSAESRNRMPAVTTLGGKQVVYSPEGGQFQILNPDMVGAADEAQPVTDATTGQVIGHNIRTPNGWKFQRLTAPTQTRVPFELQKALTDPLTTIRTYQRKLGQKDIKPAERQRYQDNVIDQQNTARDTLDTYRELGAIDDAQHAALLSQYGLGSAPAAAPAPQTRSVRMRSPSGKVGTVPAAQVKDAIAAGYQLLQ
jgi:hypothetical protein